MSQLQVKVSVIIPFYSNVKWLEQAIDSVLDQTYNNYEIIVINDGSKENVEPILQKYEDDVNYYYKENGGPSSARNLGIEKAKGDYIAFLDSDDLWLPQKLEVQLKKMIDSGCKWSYCAYSTFGDGKESVYDITGCGRDIVQRYNSPNIATPSVMIEKKLLDDHPEFRFNVNMRYGQDSFMWLIINSDYPILAIHDIMVKVRMRGNNAAKRARVQLQARGYLWEYRKQNKEQLIDKFHLSLLYRLASEFCVLGDKIIKKISPVCNNESIIEFISKVLFVTPWLLFKIDRKLKSENTVDISKNN